MQRKRGQLRLTIGVEEISEWTEFADIRDVEVLYEFLFAVADSALLRTYPTSSGDGSSLTAMVRPDIAVSLVFPEPGTFGVVAIGDPDVVSEEPDQAAGADGRAE